MIRFPYLSKLRWNKSERDLIQKILTLSNDELSYTNNYLFVLQAARDKPYKYYDGENFFILCNSREFNKDKMIILPHGKNVHCKIHQVCSEIYSHYNESVLIRKIDNELRLKLLFQFDDFKEIHLPEYRNEKNLHLLPDDVYPECIIKLNELFNIDKKEGVYGYDGYIFELKRKSLRERFRSFKNKLALENKSLFVTHLKSKKDVERVIDLIKKWSNELRTRLDKDNINIPDNESYFLGPYIKMINHVCKHNNRYFSYLIEIDGELVAASIYGRTFRETCGQYLNIAVTKNNTLKNASEFCIIVALSDLLNNYSIKWVNCGGSEYKGLHNFVLKFNPIVREMYYLYYSKK